MKNFSKIALVAAGVALVSQAAHAYTSDDLILGFNQATSDGSGGYTGPNDYVIDLGNAITAVGVGDVQVHNLSSSFSLSTFNGLFGTLNGTGMGVVGGNNAGTAARDLYLTQFRDISGGFGMPSIAGSSTPGSLLNADVGNGASQVQAMAGLTGLHLNAGGSATPAIGNANSFTTRVSPNASDPSFISKTGIDPLSIATGSVIVEDLYKADSSGDFTYTGYFTLFDTGLLTFTPSGTLPAPEPATYGIVAGIGMLVLSLRRQFTGKLA